MRAVLSLFILFLIVSISTPLRSQDYIVDSLQSLIAKAPPDTLKVRLLNELARHYLQHQIDSAQVYNQKAIQVYQDFENTVLFINLMKTSGDIQYEKANYEDALNTYKKLLVLQSSVNDISGFPKTYKDIGTCYFFMDNLDSAHIFFRHALSIHEKSGNLEGLSEAYNNIGIVLMYQGNYPQAIKNLLETVKIDEKLGNEKNQAKGFNNIGLLYGDLEEFDKAVEYYRKSLEIRRRLNDKKGLYSCLNNLGITYKNQKKYNKALDCYYEAVEIGKKLGYQKGVALTHSNIGLALAGKGDYEKALEYHKRALHDELMMHDSTRIASDYINIADVQRKMGNPGSALENLLKGIRIMEEAKYMKDLLDGYRILVETYTDLGEYKKALEFHLIYSNLNDSIFNLEKSIQIADIETRYETEKKEKEILILKEKTARQEKEKALAELTLANRKRWIYGLILSIFTLGFLAMYILQRSKRIEKARGDAAIIRERELGLKAVIDGQEEERKRIAKDLHDGIGQQLSGLKMAWQALRNKLAKQIPEEIVGFNKLTRILDETAGDVRTISHQMMPRVLNEMGLVPALEDMLQKCLESGKIQYSFEHFGLEVRFRENVEISLYRITQELVNNIIKHSGATQVSIQLFRNKQKLVLIIEDNGVGFDVREKSDGIGLMNIKSRLNTIDGEVNYEPSPGSGTVATILIPIH